LTSKYIVKLKNDHGITFEFQVLASTAMAATLLIHERFPDFEITKVKESD